MHVVSLTSFLTIFHTHVHRSLMETLLVNCDDTAHRRLLLHPSCPHSYVYMTAIVVYGFLVCRLTARRFWVLNLSKVGPFCMDVACSPRV